MKGYIVRSSEGVLHIRKNRTPILLTLFFFLSAMCLTMVVPMMNIFVYHYCTGSSIWLATMFLVIYLPLLIGFSIRLRKRIIVFDKHQNRVFLNGHVLCALTDVCEVKIGSYMAVPAKKGLLSVRGLYLKTRKGEAVEIERAGEFGANIKELGSAIADFVQVKAFFS